MTEQSTGHNSSTYTLVMTSSSLITTHGTRGKTPGAGNLAKYLGP